MKVDVICTWPRHLAYTDIHFVFNDVASIIAERERGEKIDSPARMQNAISFPSCQRGIILCPAILCPALIESVLRNVVTSSPTNSNLLLKVEGTQKKKAVLYLFG